MPRSASSQTTTTALAAMNTDSEERQNRAAAQMFNSYFDSTPHIVCFIEESPPLKIDTMCKQLSRITLAYLLKNKGDFPD